ncbi:MAG: restriction endonuclease subunit S [Cyanobacteria bacterium J06634_5]
MSNELAIKSSVDDFIKIGDISTVFDGPHATPKKIEKGPYFLSISSLESGRLDLSKSACVSENDFTRWTKRVTPREGDILFSYETRLGEAALMPSNIRACLGRRMGLLRPDLSKVVPRYLLYAYLSPDFQNEIRARTNRGATVNRIALKELPSFPVRIPSFSEQEAIAHILGSLDDKIELNRQMNETLEGMAQALFKSWFVDFDPVIDNAIAAGNEIPDALKARAAMRRGMGSNYKSLAEELTKPFPSRFEYSDELEWYPATWNARPLDTLLHIIGGGTPKTSIPEYWNGDIPWFSVVDAPSPSNLFVIDTEKHVTEKGVEKSSTKILRAGTTIISARGTVGKCALVAKPMAMNQSCFGLQGQEEISDSFVYYTVLLSVSGLQRRAHGSVFNTISRDTFKTIDIPFCGVNLTLKFEEIVRPYFEKILENSIQSKTLAKLRDTLLPQLLSGTLRIPDAEKLVSEAL